MEINNIIEILEENITIKKKKSEIQAYTVCLVIRGDILESTYFIPIFVLLLVLYITRKREQVIILKIIKNSTINTKLN